MVESSMMPRLLAVLALLAAAPASAEHGSLPLTFGGRPASPTVVSKPGQVPGDILWDSGPSDPLSANSDYLLFQGLSPDPGIAIEAAVGTGSVLSAWSPAWTERFSNGRFWGKIPVSAPAGSSVRVRVRHEGIAAFQVIEIYSLEAVLHGPEAMHIPEFSVEPSTDLPKPEVITREDWRAQPPRRAYTPMKPVRVTVHHTVGAQPAELDDSIQEMLIIQRFHQAGRGWNDICYHFLIDAAGRVFQGRPEGVYGAQVRGFNKGNVGISLMGCFHEPRNQEPTELQLGALKTLTRWVMRAYGIDAGTLKGHRDLGATACPGDNVYSKLDDLRRELGNAVLASVSAGLLRDLGRTAAGLSRLIDSFNSSGLAAHAAALFDGRRNTP